MKLVEFKDDNSDRISINIDSIVAVQELNRELTYIFVKRAGTAFTVKHSFDIVIKMIQEKEEENERT